MYQNTTLSKQWTQQNEENPGLTDAKPGLEAIYGTPILQADDSLREEEHAQDHADGEHDRDDHRELVEVLLHDAGGCAGVIQGVGNHVRDAGALAGMHQDERDQTERGQAPTDDKHIRKGTHENHLC